MNWTTSDEIATVAVVISAVSAWFSYRGSKTASDAHLRALVLQGQNLLAELNKILIADPLLWVIIDDHPLASDETSRARRQTPEFQAKLEVFTDMVANMFDVMLAELPEPGPEEAVEAAGSASWSASGVWFRFFETMLEESSALRTQMQRSKTRGLFQPAIKKAYQDWMKRRAQAHTSRGGS